MTDILQQSNMQWIAQVSQGGPVASAIVIKANPRWVSTVTQRMQPYKAMPDKFRPALEAVADYFRTQAIPRTFSQEGPGWRPLSKRTRRERGMQGFPAEHPILFRTGDLFKELTEKAHPKHVEMIKTGVNARLILGGRSEKFVRNQLGNSSLRIPSRPMIPGTSWKSLSPTDEQNILTILRENIEKVMQQEQV